MNCEHDFQPDGDNGVFTCVKCGAKQPTSRPKPQCCCDWTAYCPVHSKNGRRAYNFDPDSYIAGGS